MQKKLTITIDEQVYDGLHNVIGRGRISQFIESLIKPLIIKNNLENAYREMSEDEARENEASDSRPTRDC